jgi:hypothetical protein
VTRYCTLLDICTGYIGHLYTILFKKIGNTKLAAASFIKGHLTAVMYGISFGVTLVLKLVLSYIFVPLLMHRLPSSEAIESSLQVSMQPYMGRISTKRCA